MEDISTEDVRRQAFLMAAEGMPVRRIAEELHSMGARAPRGGRLSAATLWRMLTDPEIAEGPEAIVSKRLYREARIGLEKKRRPRTVYAQLDEQNQPQEA